jgi:hypothetical protein
VCADLANNGTGSFRVGDCDQQSGEFEFSSRPPGPKVVESRIGEADGGVLLLSTTERCKSTASSASVRTFPAPVLVSSNDEFDFFCDA